MKKWIIVGLLILGLALYGCAGLGIGENSWTMKSLLEKSREMPKDQNGWGVLSIPSKEEPTCEYLFFTQNEDWGIGIVKEGGTEGSLLLIYSKAKDIFIFFQQGFPDELAKEDAKEALDGFWREGKEDMDFSRMGPFKPKSARAFKGQEL